MAIPSTSISLPLQPWTNAKNRFLDSLPDGADRTIFEEATLENIFYSSSAGFQDHMATSKLHRTSKKLKPLFESIEGYGKAIDVLAQSSATILCPLWGSIRIVLHLALSYQKYYEKLLEMYERIGDVLPRFRSYQDLYPEHPYLLAYLTDAYFAIVTFSYDASQVFVLPKDAPSKKHEATIKLRWTPFKAQFEECTDRLRRATENIREQADIAHMEASKAFMIESRKNQDLVLADRSLQKYQDDFRRIRDLLSTYDYRAKHHSVRAHRCPGTCQWFLESETVRLWFQRKTSEPLACFGIPGAGKTILASAIIDAMIDGPMPAFSVGPAIVCYHYCDYADSKTLDAPGIIGSLARQLLDLHSDCAKSILDRCEELLHTGFVLSLSDAIFCLREALKSTGFVLVVIDGVDELDHNAQNLILEILLNTATEYPGTFKVIILGRRDERMVQRHLQNRSEVFISSGDNATDLEVYIKSQVRTCVENHQLEIQDQTMAALIVERLMNGAQQMFLWARLQIEELCYAENEEAIHQVLDHLPRTLRETYDRIVLRVSRKPRGPELLKTAQRVLRWIISARRPLSSSELGEAIAIRWDDKTLNQQRVVCTDMHILEACSNLVVQATDGTIRLAHHTVQEYLTQAADPDLADMGRSPSLQLGDTHALITNACLTYLLFTDFRTQVATSSHLDISSAMLGSHLARVAGATKHSTLMPVVASIKALKDNPVRQARLQVPQIKRNQSLVKKYLMLDYISNNWHWHAQRWWINNKRASAAKGNRLSSTDRTFGRLEKVVFLKDTCASHQPWNLPQYQPSSSVQSESFNRRLLEWSIQMDYAVMLEILESSLSDHRSWPVPKAVPKISTDEEYFSKEVELLYAADLFQACRTGSESVTLWLARRYKRIFPDPVHGELVVKAFAWINYLGGMTLETSYSVADALHLGAHVEIDELRRGFSRLLEDRDYLRMPGYIALCIRMCHLEELTLLQDTANRDDATALRTICETICITPTASWPMEDWRKAIWACVGGRKSDCLRAMHVLHQAQSSSRHLQELLYHATGSVVHLNASVSTVLMTELQSIRQYANAEQSISWLKSVFGDAEASALFPFGQYGASSFKTFNEALAEGDEADIPDASNDTRLEQMFDRVLEE